MVIVTATIALIGLPAASADPPPAADPGVVEDLGIPISSYLILDTVLADDAAGRPTLYGSTYNAPSEGVTFFGVDPVTGQVRTELAMPGAWGGYHVAAAPNGHVFLGPLNASSAAQIWEYDPVADTVSLVATMPTGIMCFGIVVSEFTGKVYCGTHSGAGVYEYDPGNGAVRLVVSTLTYPKGLTVLDAGQLVVAQGTNASVLVVDIETGATREVLPPEYSHYSFAYNSVRIGSYVYVQLVTPDNRIVRFDAATMAFDAEVPGITGMGFAPQPGTADGFYASGPGPDGSSIIAVDGGTLETTDTGIAPTWASGVRLWPVTVDGEQWLTSIGVDGLLGRWQPSTGEVWTQQLTLPGNPTNITALTAGPDGHIYGGTYETNALFGFDPETGETRIFGNVAPGRTGEILSMAVAADKLFIGSYINNVVTVFDPSQPWQPGSAPGSNPLDLGPVGESQYRPWDMEVGPDGRVWVASSGAYGELSGALTAIDPSTYEIASYRGLAGDQHLFSLAAGDEVLYVGTSRYGDDTDAGGEGRVLTVDPATGAVLSAITPVPGATRVTALETAADGTLYGSAGASWFRINADDGLVTALGTFPYGSVTGLFDGPGGDIYGTAGSAIFRIPAGTDEIVAVGSPGSGYYRTVAFGTDNRVYWGGGPSLLRVLPDVSSVATQTSTVTQSNRPGTPASIQVTVSSSRGPVPLGTVVVHRGDPDQPVATGHVSSGAAAIALTASDLGRPGMHGLYVTFMGEFGYEPSTSSLIRLVVRP